MRRTGRGFSPVVYRVLLAATLVLGVVGPARVALACPSCKEALATHDKLGERKIQGFFYSIMFMVSMPFVTVGGMSGYFYLQVRKARAQKALSPA